ncbi:GNAT family N-acetyltransferase [Paenibacillus sp. NPDC058071]|uniref:GNAT family N-acetyltransferase n=1 Tax=Paenibacillus sp. NPDC058071 TaxID=3346326 RepID=UPI0036DA02EA
MHIIDSEWSTARLLIGDLTPNEIHSAQELHEKSKFMQEYGHEFDPEYIDRCLNEGDLPPNGQRDKFKIQAVHSTINNRIVGLLLLYHGYPNDKCVYITFLFIDPDQQRLGLGIELVQELFSKLKQIGYCEVRANVQLKNWSALRFWTKAGLVNITGVHGDSNYAVDAHADIELSKQL